MAFEVKPRPRGFPFQTVAILSSCECVRYGLFVSVSQVRVICEFNHGAVHVITLYGKPVATITDQKYNPCFGIYVLSFHETASASLRQD